MKQRFLIILLASPLGSAGQVNLVPNWSFEATNTCVLGQYQGIDTVWHNDPLDFDKVQQWMSPNYVTPDYFNACQTDVLSFRVSVPANFSGFQYAKTGQAYMGILAYSNNIPFAPDGTAWEYIQTKLVSPLEAGAIYCGKFNASPSREDFDNITATDDLAMAVTKDPPRNKATPPYLDPTSDTGIYLDPQVINKGVVNKDTTAWQEIKSLFKATGGEEWATIGVFVRKEDVDTFIIRPYTKPGFEQIWTAYYYIDDVSIVKVGEPVFTSREMSYCEFPNTLAASEGFSTYRWNTGDTTRVILVNGPGVYWVQVTLEGCGVITDTVYVRQAESPSPFQLPDVAICPTQLPYTVKAPAGFQSYQWSTGESGQALSTDQPGIYFLEAVHVCGVIKDTFRVEVLPDIPDFSIGDTLVLCENNELKSVYLSPDKPLSNYAWSTGSKDSFIIIDRPGIYALRSENICGSKEDRVIATGCSTKIYIPNIFSPNDDGFNDRFEVFAQEVESVTLSIFDRWGNLLHREEGSVGVGWDGNFRGKKVESGVYTYLVSYRRTFSQIEEYLSGSVTVVR